MTRRPWPSRWWLIPLAAAASFAIPLFVSLGTVAAGLPEVLATGMCPSAPPDIPPYPCTPTEYVLRMTIGPWALMGHFAVWAAWCGILFAAGGITLAALVASGKLKASRKVEESGP